MFNVKIMKSILVVNSKDRGFQKEIEGVLRAREHILFGVDSNPNHFIGSYKQNRPSKVVGG